MSNIKPFQDQGKGEQELVVKDWWEKKGKQIWDKKIAISTDDNPFHKDYMICYHKCPYPNTIETFRLIVHITYSQDYDIVYTDAGGIRCSSRVDNNYIHICGFYRYSRGSTLEGALYKLIGN